MFKKCGLIAAVLLLVGCEEPLKEGRVIEQQHQPAHEWVSTTYIAVSTKPLIMVPTVFHHYDDEDWILIVESHVEGKKIKQRLYVADWVYDKFPEGSMYFAQGEGTYSLYDNIEKSPVE